MPAKRGGKRGGIAKGKKKEKLLKDQEGSKKKITGPVEVKAQEEVDTKAADLPNAQQDVIEAEKKNPPPSQPETTAQDLQATTKKRQKLAEELQTVEKQIFELETRYLENSHPLGSAIKGYQGLLAQNQGNPRRAIVRQEDRLFSNSSLSGIPP